MFDNLSEEKKELALNILKERSVSAKKQLKRLDKLHEIMMVAIEKDKKKVAENKRN